MSALGNSLGEAFSGFGQILLGQPASSVYRQQNPFPQSYDNWMNLPNYDGTFFGSDRQSGSVVSPGGESGTGNVSLVEGGILTIILFGFLAIFGIKILLD